jgi:hypothetical protein
VRYVANFQEMAKHVDPFDLRRGLICCVSAGYHNRAAWQSVEWGDEG